MKNTFHQNKTAKIYSLVLLLFIIASGSIRAQSARDIFQTSIEKTDPENMEMISELTIVDARQRKRVRKIASARKQFATTQKMILRLLSPPEVSGTSMLVYDHSYTNDDMWIYLPSLNKVRRIISSDKGKSFMGSEFTNADMSKPNPDDYKYERLPNESIEGTPCFVLELICQNDKISRELGYHRKKIWIDKNSFLTQKIVFYKDTGQALKKELFSDYKPVGNEHVMAMSLEMQNLVNQRKSYLVIVEYQANCTLTEFGFVPEKLSHP